MIQIDGFNTIRTKLNALHEPSAIAALTSDDSGAAMVEVHAVITAAQNLQVAMVAHFASLGAIAADGAANPAGWLRSRGMSGSAARKTADAARAVAARPDIGEAMRGGSLGVDHVASLATLAERSAAGEVPAGTIGELLDHGAVDSPDKFRSRVQAVELSSAGDPDSVVERKRKASRVTSFVDDNGMGVVHAKFDPERHAIVMAHIDAVVDQTWRRGANGVTDLGGRPATHDLGRLRADALYEIIASRPAAGAGADGAAPTTPATVVAHIDLDTLVTGVLGPDAVCRLDDGTPLTPEAVRRMACEAKIIPMVLGGKSQPLDVGRGSRLATPAQRLALEQRSATCEFAGCDVRARWCKAHHIKRWKDGGRTDLDDLCLLCDRHHHSVHEGGWCLTRGPDGLLQIRRPNGQVLLAPDWSAA